MSLPLRPAVAGGGYDYGNARVRAMHARLLDRSAYDRMLGLDADGILMALAGGPYEPDAHAAVARRSGLPALHEALSANLARTLRSVAGFYSGRARWAIDLLNERWDVANAVTLLRACVRRAPPDEVLPLIVPAGRLDLVAATELAAARDVRAAVALMVAWGMPRPEVAWEVRRALRRYEVANDQTLLERAVLRSWAVAVRAALDAGPAERRIVGPILLEEIDRQHLLVALRVREARLHDEPVWIDPDDAELPAAGGLLEPSVFDAVLRAGDDGALERALDGAFRVGAYPKWRPAVAGFDGHGDLPALERGLEVIAAAGSADLWRTGDPLSAALPVAFVLAKENEVQNLRLLGYAAAAGVPPALTRDELMVPGE